MEVTLGGDRLGSGNKQKQELHNYSRSTFNQEQDFKSSMAPGILYPFLCIPMTNGDTMDIDLDAFVRTLPTKGPLFGSFKLQVDIFSVPMRLYNGLLHNNPTTIGMKMNQVYTPKLYLTYNTNAPWPKGRTEYDWQVAPTSLLKYLGLSGIGTRHGSYTDNMISRGINAIPMLAYYDIFKNYYANKQEEKAYVITPGDTSTLDLPEMTIEVDGENTDLESKTKITGNLTTGYNIIQVIDGGNKPKPDEVNLTIYIDGAAAGFTKTLAEWRELSKAQTQGQQGVYYEDDQTLPGNVVDYGFGEGSIIMLRYEGICEIIDEQYPPQQIQFMLSQIERDPQVESEITLRPFDLKNIDDMRTLILSNSELGSQFEIGQGLTWDESSGQDGTGLPYSALFSYTSEDTNWNGFSENGLVVKTYQSDLFNNWIDTEWIEGENGVAALSAVNVESGSLDLDALNLAQKIYNMLNRIAISGGTYEDWQEAVYTQNAVRKAETPIYEGGYAAEIMFEEVIQTAETEVGKDFQALGALGGKGTLVGQRGGKDIQIEAKEPIFVMGIVSITPRICYTQGNEWYLTELDSWDDLHKPALDGIGYQDLIVEQMAWWDTQFRKNPTTQQKFLQRNSAGKVVAWSNYMTAVDKAFGDFARPEGKGFMVLARNYTAERAGGTGPFIVSDLTTYIDPAKFNYAFAYTDLAAQNFWVQIHSKVSTRRKMSAHQIPNL